MRTVLPWEGLYQSRGLSEVRKKGGLAEFFLILLGREFQFVGGGLCGPKSVRFLGDDRGQLD
ncbi:MAG: hypothetical protein HP496_03655 [Nitrospira sp.]|nr:hypothetical protein [Nitrospira sp.]